MDSRMRAALIGCGNVAHLHVSALQHAGVEIVALCDRDEQKAAQIGRATAGARLFTDATAMLAECRPQVVHILTPPSTHAALAVAAAEAGAHVLVEKPLALSTADVDRMIDVARRNGVEVIPHHNYLFKPSVQRARELIDAGEIGEVVHVDTFYGLSNERGAYGGAGRAHWAYRLPGGVFTNFLPHVAYLQAAFLAGTPSVTGVALARDPRSPDEASELTILLEGGSATGAATISTRAQPYAKYVRVFGTEAIVHADLVGEVTTVHRLRAVPRLVGKALFNLEPIPQLALGTFVNSVKVATGAMQNMPDVHAFVSELYAALAAGGELPSRAQDGRMVVGLMEEVWRRMPPQEDRSGPRRRSSPARSDPRTAVERRIAEEGGLDGRVLVTGAAGHLGRWVVTALARCGTSVRALVRDPSRVSWEVEEDADVVVGNVADPSSLRAAMRDVDLVVHCAAVTTNKAPWTVHRQTNVDGTRAVLDAAQEAGARRLVHVSSVIVYGLSRSGSQRLNESSPTAGEDDRWAFYLRSKLAAEQALLAASGDAPEIVIVRPGIVYGPDSPPSVSRLQLGSTAVTLGRGNNHLPYTYVDDVVDGILLALTVPRAAGEIYNLVHEPMPDVRTVRRLVIDLRGGPTRVVPIPAPALRLAAAALERRRERAGSDVAPAISRFVVDSATRDLRYDSGKARRELGWMPAVGLEEGLRRSLASADAGPGLGRRARATNEAPIATGGP